MDKEMDKEMEESLNKLFTKFDKEFKNLFGEQCSTYSWNCIQCNVHDIFERFKKDLFKEYMRK